MSKGTLVAYSICAPSIVAKLHLYSGILFVEEIAYCRVAVASSWSGHLMFSWFSRVCSESSFSDVDFSLLNQNFVIYGNGWVSNDAI